MLKQKSICGHKFLARVLLTCLLVSNVFGSVTIARAGNTLTLTDTLAVTNPGVTSSHTLALTTTLPLDANDVLEFYLPDFVLDLDDANNVNITSGPGDTAITYDNSAKKITLTFPSGLVAGVLALEVMDGKITNPSLTGQFILNATTHDVSNDLALFEFGSTNISIANQASLTTTVHPAILGVSSSNSDGTYLKTQTVSIQIIFSENVIVTGTPRLTLNSGGKAYYASGSGNSILTFTYTIDTGETTSDLDYASSSALTLASDTIASIDGIATTLTLPTPGGVNSLATNKNLAINGGASSTSPPPPTPPSISSVSITTTNGITSDATPPIQLGSGNNPSFVALSCDDGTTWSAWSSYPADHELNTNDDADFNLTTSAGCTTNEGTKTITVKLKGSNGLESGTASTSVIYATPPTSTLSLTENSIVKTFSIANNTATLAGSATSTSGTITAVEINLKQNSDGKYFDGAGWNTTNPVWLVTSAKDGTFNSATENWEYRGSVPSFVNNGTYIVQARAKKMSDIVETNPPSKTFIFDASVPDLIALTAGPSTSVRTGLISGQTFGKSATGNDDQISFAWTDPVSTSDDTFYYELNEVASADQITGTENSVTTPYVNQITIADGTSYFHVRPKNGNGTFGVERVFVVKYKKSAATLLAITGTSGTYSGGDTVNFTLTFSEPVKSADNFTVYFDSGGSAVIPTFTIPTTSVNGQYIIDTFENSSSLHVLATLGTLVNNVGNALVNPAPQTNLSGVIIVGAKINLSPSTTTNTFILTPNAPGASEMYIHANGIKTSTVALKNWIPYSGNPLTFTATDIPGTYVVKIEFRNATGKTYTTSATLTRLPTPAEQIVAAEQQQLLFQTELNELSELTNGIVETFSLAEQQLLADTTEQTPELLIKLADALLSQNQEQIHASAATIQSLTNLKIELQNLLQKNEITSLLAKFSEYVKINPDAKLNTILTLAEIEQILRSATSNQRATLEKYLDLNLLTLSTDPKTGIISVTQKTAAARDSDGDGLSDALELKYRTNPFHADTDGDGFSDGMEILDLGTDPLDANSPGKNIPVKFTNLTEAITLADPAPLLRGVAPSGMSVKIYAVSENGARIALGTVTADEENKWILASNVTLPEGKYIFQIVNTENKILRETSVVIDLDFVLPAPEIFLTVNNETDLPIFSETQPNFYGNTYYGSTIVASFQSPLTSTSVIADNPQGDFTIRPPRELEKGNHTLIVYAELPDGTRSTTKVLKFVIDPEHVGLLTETTALDKIFSLKNLILFVLLGNLVYLTFYLRRKHEPENGVA